MEKDVSLSAVSLLQSRLIFKICFQNAQYFVTSFYSQFPFPRHIDRLTKTFPVKLAEKTYVVSCRIFSLRP